VQRWTAGLTCYLRGHDTQVSVDGAVQRSGLPEVRVAWRLRLSLNQSF
jgi:hypothetical protein